MRGFRPRLSLLLLLITICGTSDPLPVLAPPREARSRPPHCNIPGGAGQQAVRPPAGGPGARGAGKPPGLVLGAGWGEDVDPQVFKLMERAVLEGGDGPEALREMHDGMLQLRLNRVYPRRVDVADLRARTRTGRLRLQTRPIGDQCSMHILRVRAIAEAEWKGAVRVVPYDGGGGVHFALLWRVAPDRVGPSSHEPGRDVNISSVAFQPLHPSIDRPLWTVWEPQTPNPRLQTLKPSTRNPKP
jgi:hypothetical protein